MAFELRYLAPVDAADPYPAIAAAIEAVRAINAHQPSDVEIHELLEQAGLPVDAQAVAHIHQLTNPSKEPTQ